MYLLTDTPFDQISNMFDIELMNQSTKNVNTVIAIFLIELLCGHLAIFVAWTYRSLKTPFVNWNSFMHDHLFFIYIHPSEVVSPSLLSQDGFVAKITIEERKTKDHTLKHYCKEN